MLVEIIADEDVAKEVFLEKRIDGRRKELISGRRRDFVASAQTGAYFGAVFIFVDAGRNGRRFFSDGILDACFSTLIHHFHESMNGIEASRESRICVKLYKYLFDFVDRQACLEAFGKVALQSFKIAVCRV